MLKWSFKNRKYFLVQKQTSLEMRIKLSRVLIKWFIRYQYKFELLNYSWYIISRMTKFIKSFLYWLITIQKRDRIYSRKFTLMGNHVNKFFQILLNFNNILYREKSLILIDFYRQFLCLCWLIEPFIINKNKINIDFLANNYMLLLDNRTIEYIYEYIDNVIIKGSNVKKKTACFMTGRSRAVVRAFKLSRFKVRELVNLGLFVGLTKSSW